MVAREAMAYGRPVVASRVGGLADAVDDGVTGVLVAPRDVGALRVTVLELLGSRDARARLASAARSGTMSHARNASPLQDALRDAISARPRGECV
jgi:glycosyltransferase involved in cell wall biosynthesis